MNAPASRLRRIMFTTSALAAASVFTALLGTAPAMAQNKQTQSKPTKSTRTTTPPAPIVQVTRVRPDAAELTVGPGNAGFQQQYQVISGPNAAGTPISTNIGPIFIGLQNVLGRYPIELLPNSDYHVRVRNTKGSVNVSNWTTVFFRTPAQFDTRPNAPGNLRITQQTDTSVTLAWDAPPFAAPPNPYRTYELFLNNQRTNIFQCGGPYVTCTEANFRTVGITRPPAGTPLTFGVAARDGNLNRSEISTIQIQ